MIRTLRPMTSFVVIVYTALACATSGTPDPEKTATRPAPTAQALEAWLHHDPSGSEHSARYFLQMSDPQLGMSEYPLLMLLVRATYRDDHFERDARLFESAIRHANELRPDFVIICGDLVHRLGHEGQLAEFERIAALLDPSIPLHLVAGNHDVGNEPTAASLMAYRKRFGPDRYSFQEGGVYGIVLNSQIINRPGQAPMEAERQLGWVREELDRARASGAQHILVFQHHPYFVEQATEKDSSSNIEGDARAIYLELFKKAGVEAVLAGHLHRTAGAHDEDLESIITGPIGRPIGDDPSGFRIVEVLEDSLHHEYFSLDPAE